MSETTQAVVEPWMFQAPQSEPAAPPAQAAAPTPDQARASLEQLRADRLEGKVTDRDFFERSDYLARLAHGEQGVAPPPKRFEHMTPTEQAEHLYEESMRPAKAGEYDLPGAPYGDEQALARNTEVREAMAAVGIPKQYGRFFFEQINRSLQLAQSSPAAIDANQTAAAAKLQAQWGDQFKARVQAVSDLLDDAAESNPLVARLLDHAPHVFSDPWIMHTLWLVAEHRRRRPRR